MWDMFVVVAIWGTPGDSISFLHFDQVIYSLHDDIDLAFF